MSLRARCSSARGILGRSDGRLSCRDAVVRALGVRLAPPASLIALPCMVTRPRAVARSHGRRARSKRRSRAPTPAAESRTAWRDDCGRLLRTAAGAAERHATRGEPGAADGMFGTSWTRAGVRDTQIVRALTSCSLDDAFAVGLCRPAGSACGVAFRSLSQAPRARRSRLGARCE
jgi:hypothetical protein